jgi:hypothetical protein
MAKRICRWKEWKRGHIRKRNLQRLGVPEWAALRAGHTRAVADGARRRPPAGDGPRALGGLALRSLAKRYAELWNGWRTAGCGPRTSGAVRGGLGQPELLLDSPLAF